MKFTSKNDNQVAALTALSENLVPGNVLSYTDIENAIQVPRGTGRWGSISGRWQREELRHRNRKYQAVPSVGYMLLGPAGRLEYARNRVLSLSRSIDRMHILVSTTDVMNMTPAEEMLRMVLLNVTRTQVAVLEAGGPIKKKRKKK
jgi:hypothetical protein